MSGLVGPKLYVAIGLYLQVCIVAHLVRLRRKRFQIILLHCMEALLTAVWAFLHSCLIMLLHQFPDSLVEFQKRVERTVSQLGVYSAVADSYRILYEGFLGRRHRVTWKHHKMVVIAHVLQCLVKLGLMPVIAYYGRLQVVWRKYGRNASQMFQAHSDGIQEIFCFLRWDTYHISIVAVRHGGNEDLYLYHLASLNIDIPQFVARKVHHELFAWFVGV